MKQPDLFNTLSQYVSHGDLVKESYGTPDTLDEETQKKYEDIFIELKKLELDVTDENIKNKIIKYKGHMNLIVRDILCENIK